mmetsp:Transcript_18357/g.59176  ORF Transcript_18357/g.59176 Transcript_18357/m.59176 type:complete len:179 (-) Transcript_18357:194-730(-)
MVVVCGGLLVFFVAATTRLRAPASSCTILRARDEDPLSPEALMARARELREEAEELEATLPAPPKEPTTQTPKKDPYEPPANVVRQVVHAFDNLPSAESTEAVEAIWKARDKTARDKLMELAEQADDLEDAFLDQRLSSEDAADAIRVLRSRIRMWTKDFLPKRDDDDDAGLFGFFRR